MNQEVLSLTIGTDDNYKIKSFHKLEYQHKANTAIDTWSLTK